VWISALDRIMGKNVKKVILAGLYCQWHVLQRKFTGSPPPREFVGFLFNFKNQILKNYD